jgi:hypothetical protein
MRRHYLLTPRPLRRLRHAAIISPPLIFSPAPLLPPFHFISSAFDYFIFTLSD